MLIHCKNTTVFEQPITDQFPFKENENSISEFDLAKIAQVTYFVS